MERWTTTLVPTLLGLGLLMALPHDSVAQEGDPPKLDCSTCTRFFEEFPDGLCIPAEWGADGCKYEDGGCVLTGEACNPEVALSVPEEDRLVIPTDGGSVVAVRLEGNTFGDWACDGELKAVYRDWGNGVIVEVVPAELDGYKNRYRFESYAQSVAAQAPAGG